MSTLIQIYSVLNLLHSKRPELYKVLAVLSAIGLNLTISKINYVILHNHFTEITKLNWKEEKN